MKYQVSVPVGEHGNAKIDQFTIERESAQFENLKFAINGYGSRRVEPGTYTRLTSRGTLWMTDTPAEVRDHMPAIREVERRKGRVLIHGLGIGLVLQASILAGADHIDVVEYDEDVIALVGPHYEAMADAHGVELNIVHADAYEHRFPKGTSWTVAWHDIWPTLSEDNLPLMAKLNRRYARATDWQGCWSQDEVRYQRARANRYYW